MKNYKKNLFRDLNSNWKVKLFLLSKIPSAFFMGIRLSHLSIEKCHVKLPFTWFTKNPFKSMYFASQCAAAELSTGFLLAALAEQYGKVSMLVVSLESTYHKKADDTIIFKCQQGKEINAFLEKVFRSGNADTIDIKTIGVLNKGNIVSDFTFKWSIMPK